MPGGQKNPKQNRSNIVTDSIKTFKMDHIKKKKILKKISFWALKWSQHLISRLNVFGQRFKFWLSASLAKLLNLSRRPFLCLQIVSSFLRNQITCIICFSQFPEHIRELQEGKNLGRKREIDTWFQLLGAFCLELSRRQENKKGAWWSPQDVGVPRGWSVRCAEKGFRDK